MLPSCVSPTPKRRCASRTTRRSGCQAASGHGTSPTPGRSPAGIQTGSLCINDALFNYFCVEAPLGGVKSSGLGFRHGPDAIPQFCRTETIVEDHPLLGWLSPIVGPQLMFPYRSRTHRLLRRFMRWFY